MFNLLRILFVLMLVGITSQAQAESLDSLTTDLSRIEGSLLTTSDGRILINKGKTSGVHKGDLWTISEPGESIKDPVTGKMLGQLSTPIAHCRTVKVEQEFSEITCTCIQSNCKPKQGQIARRFDEIPVIFQDSTGEGTGLYELMRSKLPHLKWEAYTRIQGTFTPPAQMDRVFVHAAPDMVTIWSGGETVALYKTSSLLPKTQASAPSAGTGPIPGIKGSNTQLTYESFRHVGSLDFLVDHVELAKLDASNNLYFIYLSKRTISIQPAGKPERFSYSYDGFGEVLGISVGTDGLIALNIYIPKEGFKSRILRFNGDHIEIAAKNIPYMMAFFDLDGNGTKETLIGQNFDKEDLFGAAIHKLAISGNDVVKKESFTVPASWNVNGAFIADINGNGTLDYGYYNVGKKLVVYERNRLIYESAEPLGGSIKSIQVEPTLPGISNPKTFIIWSPPAVVKTGETSIVAIAANDNTFWNMVGGPPSKGTVGILYPTGGRLVLRKLNTAFDGPVQSVFTYKDELYVVVVSGNFFSGTGQTHILAITFKDLAKALGG